MSVRDDSDRGPNPAILASPDPTATKTLRDRATGNANHRHDQLRGEVRRALGPGGDLRQFIGPDVVSAAQFRQWLNTKLDDHIRDSVGPRAIEQGRHWTGPFVTDAYRSGLDLADTLLQEQGYAPPERPPGAALSDRAYQRELAEERTRLYTDVLGVADDTLTDATRAFSDLAGEAAGASMGPGVGGRGPDRAAYEDIIEGVNARIDAVGQTRTRQSLETRIVEAVNIAAIRRYDEAGVDRVGVVSETVPADDVDAAGDEVEQAATLLDLWGSRGEEDISRDEAEEEEAHFEDPFDDPRAIIVSAFDDRVCPECLDLEGSILFLDEIYNEYVEIPPYHVSCRCLLYPF